ncbi:hypothetical protein MPTK1_1g27010 [Marchantia polymorpha subsp. ruderalis]|uniref:Uncharacterized protein n=2 Tax=Marchantia polymorpha TaxID=3197 RepID=A0AAF6AUQ6_MARPO|nr:hypothetical protein MARPO_0002s0177 [Marchantia polymorpha]BBN00177.1 hypothetical protein Mp_1g27010 [Marchantia polymorpha subsp. ruderalis]|eukprot:PTQ49707.1 hypothetical protein MARPO_0002s0177 [Marchantia polymorpha]
MICQELKRAPAENSTPYCARTCFSKWESCSLEFSFVVSIDSIQIDTAGKVLHECLPHSTQKLSARWFTSSSSSDAGAATFECRGARSALTQTGEGWRRPWKRAQSSSARAGAESPRRAKP